MLCYPFDIFIYKNKIEFKNTIPKCGTNIYKDIISIISYYLNSRMSRSKKIILHGIKRLDDLEKGLYRKDKTSYYVIKKNHNDLMGHDDEIETEFDEIILPDDDDLFDKKMININISNSIAMINKFPNALLLEESIFNSSDKKPIDQPIKEKVQPVNDIAEDIWNILDKIKKENASESLDTLITESEETEADSLTNSEDQHMICKSCKSKNTLIEDQRTRVIVCSSCGCINEELLDYGPEWRQYNNDDNRGDGVNRCGCPSNFFFPKSSQGTIMGGSSNSRLKRKQKWNCMVYKERSLNQVFEFISHIGSKNNIPKIIIDSAKIFYKKLSDCKHKNGTNVGKQIIIRGENRVSIIAACLFKACEVNKSPRSVKEIADFFNLEEKKVTRGNKQFERIMKNTDDNTLMLDQFKTTTPEDYIRRHCPKLRVNKANTDMAVRISHNCCKMKLASDHNPQSIAAGSILVMVEYCDLNIEKKDIAKLFGTSDVTIGKIYNKIAPYVQALVDDAATEYLIDKFKING